MTNFLFFTRMKPTANFMGCLPVRVGMFFVFLFMTGITVGDYLEHVRIFEGQKGMIDKWISFSIQVVITLMVFMNVIFKNKSLSLITYLFLVLLALGTVAEKGLKLIFISKVFMATEKINLSVLKNFSMERVDLEMIYSCRIAAEFLVLYYSSYICFSYEQECSRGQKDGLVEGNF